MNAAIDPAAVSAMTAVPVLNVQAIGKSYSVYRSNFHRIAYWIGFPVKPQSRQWAIQDVNFTIQAGESIAIIGQNGAGKSTLLKLITGTVRPSTGTIRCAGRISAMLELGLGFNPEFTGRQNVYLAGGLMGFSTTQLDKFMPEIEEFAEIGEFFDRPLRVYSSGMQARLAFAVATAERPDILIVDEVLSVGDSYFQHRCFDRIRAFRAAGTSIILVSHAMGDVRSLCERVILLSNGTVLRDGPADEVVDYYNALIAAQENAKLSVEQRRLNNGWVHTRSGSGEAVMTKIALQDAETGADLQLASVGQRLRVVAEIEVKVDLPYLVLGYLLRDKFGNTIWGTNTWHTGHSMAVGDHLQSTKPMKAGQRIAVSMTFEARLGPGSYALSYALHADDSHLTANYEWVDNALVFDVANLDKPYFIGTNWLSATFEVKHEPA